MARRSRARYLVPIALIAVIAGTYVVIHDRLNPKPTTTQSSTTATTGTSGGNSPAKRRLAREKFYRVKSGDSLTGIASKTGIPVTTLEALNPKVDPNSLQTGERVRLRR